MKMKIKILCILVLVFAWTTCSWPVDVEPTARSVIEPVPFKWDGKTVLAYELFVRDVALNDLTIKSLDVSNGDPGGDLIAHIEGEGLIEISQKLENQMEDLVIFMWLTFENSLLPKTLKHKITFTNSSENVSYLETNINVSNKTAKVISPPVKGEKWLAYNGPSNNDHHHRRTLMYYMGIPFLSQRFAIDWLKFTKNNRPFKSKGDKNTDYSDYGDSIYSVADGTVVDVRKGLPDNTPLDTPAVPITLGTASGNYVIVDIGDHIYAFYAHLIPGSIRVRVGQKVEKGQSLGRLGNSGNSGGPHLHFHLCDSPDAIFSQGVPYVFETYIDLGTYKGTYKDDEGPRIPWIPDGTPKIVDDELPFRNEVISFSH
jgi:hypothetical protein